MKMKGFTVYKSSAGSGKTYVLVKTYLSLLFSIDSNYGFKQILGITFTNKAANEMKKRVFLSLEKIVEEGITNSLAIEIALENNFDINRVVSRAQIIYDKILHNYSDFNLMTIDKFTNQVIRAFSNELELSETYDIILEEVDFLEQSISEFIDKAADNSFQLDLIQQFIDESIRQGVQNDIEKQLKKLNKIIFESEFKNKQSFNVDDLLSLRNHFLSVLKIKEADIDVLCKEGSKILENSGIEINWQLYGRVDKVLNSFIKLKEIKYQTLENWLIWRNDEQWFKKSLKPNQMKIVENVKLDLFYVLNAIIDKLLEWLKLVELYKFITPFSLVKSLVDKIEFKKKQENAILISDFNFLISDIIKHEPAGFIFERIGYRYQYILIDEFQDTSKMQWSNLIPLIHESLANGGKNLIVGDSKQAIYRWRSGDVKQFLDLPTINDSYLSLNYQSLISHSFDKKVLENNWRSSINIVQFNNWLFDQISKLATNTHVLEAYKDVKQQFKRDFEGSLHFNLKTKDKFNLNEYLFNKINIALSKGYNYADIVILIRSKNDGLKIINELENLKIPYVSEDTVFLGSSISYKLLYYALSFFEFKKEDDLKLLLHFLKVYFNKELDLDLTKAIDNFNFFEFQNLIEFQKLYYVIDLLGLSFSDPYVEVFFNSSIDKIKDEHFTIGQVLDFLNENSHNIVVATGALNAIQIMTIHKSKGLEFPIVIIPFGTWPNKNSVNNPFIWVEDIEIEDFTIKNYIAEQSKKSLCSLGKNNIFIDEENALILDNLNLYYVAFTRAADHLYIAMDDSKSNKNVSDLIVSCVKNHDFFQKESNQIIIEDSSNYSPITYDSQFENHSILAKENSKFIDFKIQNFFSFVDEPNVGTVFHQAMSKVLDDFSNAYEFLDNLQKQGKISFNMISQCKSYVKNIEKSKQFDFLFNDFDHVYNEREVIGHSGDILRLDRLVIKQDNAIIVDYKTSKDESKQHEEQLINYKLALQNTGFKKVYGYLVYVSSLNLIEV
tara:strand:- start:27555 stop:30575 length:3021 start_codon:yes stop_codon:yes gene_type:complete